MSYTPPPTRRPRHAILATALALMLALSLPLGRGTVEAAPAPTISSVSPSLGPSAGGTVVTITGTGFIVGASVTFGGVSASSISIVSATQITATTPAGAPGAVIVAVTNVDTQGATLSGGFIYQYAPPTVTSIAPATGTSAGGTAVTITGTGFRAGASASIGSKAATSVIVVSGTTITAVAPANVVGASNVVVMNSDSQGATLSSAYTYTAATTPTVTSVAPASGSAAGGTSITVTGTNFVTGATVLVGGTAATAANVTNATTITATTPAHTSGVVSVSVSNPDTQTGAASSAFTYNPLPAPTIASISPTSGPSTGGTSVTITGTNFVAGATVTIGGAALNSTTVASATSILGTAPAHNSGLGPVVVTNPDGQTATLATGFTWAANATPTVAAISPSSGSTTGGTSISITGTGFMANATVQIGGSPANSVTVVSPTLITAVTPAHAATTAATAVTVTNSDGLGGSNVAGFTYKAEAAPVVSAVTPSSGTYTGGTIVTITGTGLASGATVMFGTYAGYGTIVAGGTSIIVTTPTNAVGNVPIIVTNPDGQVGVLASGFTFLAPPATILAVDPATGPASGGTDVSISGTNFATGASVTFGGIPATKVLVTSSGSIFATTPPMAALSAATPPAIPGATTTTAPATASTSGSVDVAVTNPGSSAVTMTAGFTYAAPGSANVATVPPVGGMTFVVAGTTDLPTLVAAQKFTVVAAFTFDVPKQIWKVWVAGAPVSSLTGLAATDIVALRR